MQRLTPAQVTPSVLCAEGGTRTRTFIAEHRILSPVRLPIPPLRRNSAKDKG